MLQIGLVDIAIMQLSWYELYCRKFPVKDEENTKDLTALGPLALPVEVSIYLHILHMSDSDNAFWWSQVPTVMQGVFPLLKQIWNLHC